MALPDIVTAELLVTWGLSALGVYHLILILRRRLFAGSRYDRRDAASQLRQVMAAEFSPRKVMGFGEYRVFKAVEDEVHAHRAGYRVFSQTSLGEVLQSRDSRAHSAINSKRVDVLVISATGYPAIAVEFQGKGHYQKDAAARDAVKKEALRKAGVEYIEVAEHFHANEVRRLVRDALTRMELRSSTRIVAAQ